MYSKLKISEDATSKLRSLRQRCSLTPNLLCRLALMISLEEGPIGRGRAPDEDGMEFNAYTLTGEYTQMFALLIRFREELGNKKAKLSDDEVVTLMRAHIHRGVRLLAVRCKSPADVA